MATSAEKAPLLPTARTAPRGLLPPVSDELFGYTLMLLSCIGFSAMSLGVHVAETVFHFPAMHILFLRGATQSAFAALYIFCFLDVRATFGNLTARQWRLLILRGCFGGVGLVCLFKALSLLPVGPCICIFFIGPIFTMILSNITLGERVTVGEIAAAFISLFGIVLVAQPSTGFDAVALDGFVGIFGISQHVAGALLALAGAALSACAYVTVRSLGKGIHFMLSVLSLGVVSGTIAIFPLGGFTTLADIIANPKGSAVVFVSVCCAFMGQCTLNKGLQHCRAGPGVLLRNLDVPIAYILGIAFLSEIPSFLGFVGSALVFCSALFIGMRQVFRSSS